MLKSGTKLLVVHRRLFPGDQIRFFVGTVAGCDSGFALVRGYTWIRDILAGGYYRKEELRTKVVSLVSGTLFVYELPEDVEISHVKFLVRGQVCLLTDGQEFRMDLTEYEFHQSTPLPKP